MLASRTQSILLDPISGHFHQLQHVKENLVRDRLVTMVRISLLLLLIVVSSPFLRGQDTEITNARVIEMTKLGLGDDIIVARIKTGACKFSISDSDLAGLKKENVSDKV